MPGNSSRTLPSLRVRRHGGPYQLLSRPGSRHNLPRVGNLPHLGLLGPYAGGGTAHEQQHEGLVQALYRHIVGPIGFAQARGQARKGELIKGCSLCGAGIGDRFDFDIRRSSVGTKLALGRQDGLL